MKYYKTTRARKNFFEKNKGSIEVLTEVLIVKDSDLVEFLSTDEKFFKRWNGIYNKLGERLQSHKKRMLKTLS